jgi:hypothetical protein
MVRALILGSVLCSLCLWGHGVRGDEPPPAPACARAPGCCNYCGLLLGCPDDYIRKPLPALGCLPPCCQPDDYCRKPCPFIHCLGMCGGPDDYCRKAMPHVCRPLNPEHFTCGPDCHSPQPGPEVTATRLPDGPTTGPYSGQLLMGR